MKRAPARIKRHIYALKYRFVDGFIFIHINKTGGSSVEKALHIPTEHKTALEMIEETGIEYWERKFTFTIVRNPWDKVVSHYHYRVRTNQTGLLEARIEFTDWVKRTYGNQDGFYYDKPKMFMPQLKWISDTEENVLVDEILCFENLPEEFNKVLGKIGKKNVTLPHVKKSDRNKYQYYYDKETIEIVRAWFEMDIKTFGYQF